MSHVERLPADGIFTRHMKDDSIASCANIYKLREFTGGHETERVQMRTSWHHGRRLHPMCSSYKANVFLVFGRAFELTNELRIRGGVLFFLIGTIFIIL